MALTVISLNNVPPRLRGYLTKYLWEINTGVYIGNVSKRVRDNLWKRCIDTLKDDSKVIMAYPADNEQGFDIEAFGGGFAPADFDGITLVRKQHSQLSRPTAGIKTEDYIVLDLETTGLDVSRDHIIEIGALHISEGQIIDRFHRITDVAIPEEILKLSGQGLADDQEKSKCDVHSALQDLSSFIGGRTVVGYNIRTFDARGMQSECRQNNVEFPFTKVIDVIDLVRKDPDTHNTKMYSVAKEKGIEVTMPHRAIPDCFVCNELYQFYLHKEAAQNN